MTWRASENTRKTKCNYFLGFKLLLSISSSDQVSSIHPFNPLIICIRIRDGSSRGSGEGCVAKEMRGGRVSNEDVKIRNAEFFGS